MMPSLTLYQANGSCAFVPHAILLHFGIPAKMIRMQLGPDGYASADGSITRDDYLKIHPSAYVPALDVDGEVITELPAIVTFIASLAPEGEVLGRDGIERARVVEWLTFLSGTLHGQGFGMWWRGSRFSDDETMYDAIKAKGRTVILKCFDRIESRLKDKEFAVGNSLTAADFYLYIFTRWGKEIGIDMEEYPAYSKLASRMESVEGVQLAIKEEDLKYHYS